MGVRHSHLDSAVDFAIWLCSVDWPCRYGTGGRQNDVKSKVVKVVHPQLRDFRCDCPYHVQVILHAMGTLLAFAADLGCVAVSILIIAFLSL